MICYRGVGEELSVILDDSVLAHFNRFQQRTAWCREAGGQLFSRLACDNALRIERATGPKWSDWRSRTSFLPNRRAERREIRRLFKRGEHFVGDWHTHPQDRPEPSYRDVESTQEMFSKSKHSLRGFILAIVGRVDPPDGLFVALVDSDTVHELRALRCGAQNVGTKTRVGDSATDG